MERIVLEPAGTTRTACPADTALTHMYRTQYPQIRAICTANGLQCVLCSDSLRIISRYDCWRIYLHVLTGRPVLFHRSRRPRYGSKVPHYHEQHCPRDSIVQMLKYIVEHDLYRMQLDVPPSFRNTTKGRKARKAYEQKQHRWQTARTLAIIEEISSFNSPLPKEKTA